jgi:hypothetical protein
VAVVNVTVVKGASKDIVRVSIVSVSTTLVVVTAEANAAPPDCVIVKAPISLPILPDTLNTPSVLIVKLDDEPDAVPDTDARLISFEIPVPIVSVTPSASVVDPKVIAPALSPPKVVVPDTLIPDVTPARLITPEPPAAIVPAK